MIETNGTTVRVSGAMTLREARSLRDAGLGHLAAGAQTVDLSGVDEADSAALAVLASWHRAAIRRGTRLAVTGVPESLHSLAGLYRVGVLLGEAE